MFLVRRLMALWAGSVAAFWFLPQLAAVTPASLSVVANAKGETAVRDTASNIYWYWDLSRFSSQSFSQQSAAIQQLNLANYFGLSSWHLATDAEMQTLWPLSSQTIRQAFHPSHERYEGSYQWHYWDGRYGGTVYGDEHMAAQTAWGNFFWGPFDYAWPEIFYTVDGSGGQELGAWVVAVVPEPNVATLTSLGLALFGLLRGRQFRSAILR